MLTLVLTDVLAVVLALLSAVLVGFVARRILDTPVGWPRSLIVGLLVFAAGFPLAGWVLDESGVLPEGGQTDDARTALVAIAILLLALAWVFALGVAALVALEALFPTRPLSNPLAVIRAAGRRSRRTRRYLQILGIASRHGIGWMFTGSSRATQELTTAQQRAQALVSAINDSGVSFVKLGQVLSTRRDMIPEPYISALGSLQSSATTLAWSEIRGVIQTEIGGSLDTVFASVDEVPLAAASVAQVHTATLLDGTPVVVKVQRAHRPRAGDRRRRHHPPPRTARGDPHERRPEPPSRVRRPGLHRHAPGRARLPHRGDQHRDDPLVAREDRG